MLKVLLLTASLLVGDVPAPELKTQVMQQVRHLNAPAGKARDEAEQALLKLGPEILEVLPIPNNRMRGEMRERIVRIRKILEDQKARSEVAERRVTLPVGKMKLSDALKQLEKQSGNRLIDYRKEFGQKVTDPEVSLDLVDVSFWKALDTILYQANLTVYPYATNDEDESLAAVALVSADGPAASRSKNVAYDGTFRFEAIEIRARRGLRDPEGNRLRLEIEAAWEPRIKPLTLSIENESVEATLPDGSALEVVSSGSQALGTEGGQALFEMGLALPSREVKSIQRVHGKVKALLPGRIESFRFTRLAPDRKQQLNKGGVTVELTEVRKNNSLWEVHAKVRFDDSAGALQSHLLGWVTENEAYLETSDKKRVEVAALEDLGGKPGEYTVKYLFAVEGDLQGHTFVYKTPAALVEQEIQFDFGQLKLP